MTKTDLTKFESNHLNHIRFSVGDTIENSFDFDTYNDALRFARMTDNKYIFVHVVVCDVEPIWENMCLKKSGEFSNVILAQINV